MRHCSTCDTKKPDDEFRRIYTHGRHWECSACEQIRKENRSYKTRGLDPKKMRKLKCASCRASGYLYKDGDRFFCHACRQIKSEERTINREESIRHRTISKSYEKYGLSAEQYRKLDKRCTICRTTEKLCVDHDHSTMKFRSLLCTRCNTGIGFFEDDAGLLRKAAQYIEDHKVKKKPWRK